jgi:putative FmdB family regulatory protein
MGGVFGRGFRRFEKEYIFRGKEKMLLTYEYECGFCGHQFEFDQHIKDEPLSKCPKCGKKPTRLISGGSGFIWKGGDNGPGRFNTPLNSCPIEESGATCCAKGKPCDKKPVKPKTEKKPRKKSV